VSSALIAPGTLAIIFVNYSAYHILWMDSQGLSLVRSETQLQAHPEIVESFNRKVDTSVSRLYDSYSIILNHSQVETSLGGHEQPLLLSAAANIVSEVFPLNPLMCISPSHFTL
jgi:hypothetical protein